MEAGYSTLLKVSCILECFSMETPVITAHQISKHVHIPVSSLYRYLQTMVQLRILNHNRKNNTYSIGTNLIELGGIGVLQYKVRYAALEPMQQLSQTLKMNVNLSILDECDIVHLAYVTAEVLNPTSCIVGRRSVAYQTAMGRVMLAYEPFDQVQEMIIRHHEIDPEHYPLPDFTKLEHELQQANQNGFVMVNDHTFNADFYCLAYPIHKQNGKVCAAMSVNWFNSGASYPIRDLTTLRETVAYQAMNISFKMGYTKMGVWME